MTDEIDEGLEPADCGCSPGGCCASAPARTEDTHRWTTGTIATPAGDVPRLSTEITTRDRIGAWKVRWGLGRMGFRVEPGLYAIGAPSPESPVLVTANYKLTLDRLRSQLVGMDAWVLVLDTKGINVWCAAGKGTFGTAELMQRVATTRLGDVVSHRNLVVPQLGATGVSAHTLRDQSGWRVRYGPVRAEDLPDYLRNGMKTPPAARMVRFPLMDRLGLVPMELVGYAGYLLCIAAGLLLLSGLGPDGYSFERIQGPGLRGVALLLAAYLGGVALTPALLPWIPGRAFAVKGAWIGLMLAAPLALLEWAGPGVFSNPAEAVAWLLLIPAVSSFLAMNFTGASTYTSLSGVRREMRAAVPKQIAGAALALILWIFGRFV